MRICVFGAGAIGGFLGARLAAAGHPTSAVARGATLRALRTHGWRLRVDGEQVGGPVLASEDPALLGEQDLVIVALKAQALPGAATAIGTLVGTSTVVLPAMNGVPWWFLADRELSTVDPDGAVARAVPVRHVLGCVVHASCRVDEPGVVHHVAGNGLIIGEPAGGDSARLSQVEGALGGAGFEVTVSADIRRDVWYKLWGNMTMNPVSALTGATADRILDDPLVNQFCQAVMREAAEIGARIGCAIDQSPAERNQITRRLGAFRTSMLQDAEAGRQLELDAMVGAVREIGRQVGVDTPAIDTLLGLTRLSARVRGLYPENEK